MAEASIPKIHTPEAKEGIPIQNLKSSAPKSNLINIHPKRGRASSLIQSLYKEEKKEDPTPGRALIATDHEFSPHLWKPNICKFCFTTHEKATGTPETVEEPDISVWQRSHASHVDLIRSTLTELPFIENILFTNVFQNEDGIELGVDIHLNEEFISSKNPASFSMNAASEAEIKKLQEEIVGFQEKEISLQSDLLKTQSETYSLSKKLLDSEQKVSTLEAQLNTFRMKEVQQQSQVTNSQLQIEKLHAQLHEREQQILQLEQQIQLDSKDSLLSSARVQESELRRINREREKILSEKNQFTSRREKLLSEREKLLQTIEESERTQFSQDIDKELSYQNELIGLITKKGEALEQQEQVAQKIKSVLEMDLDVQTKNLQIKETESTTTATEELINEIQAKISSVQTILTALENSLFETILNQTLLSNQKKIEQEKNALEAEEKRLSEEQEALRRSRISLEKAKEEAKKKEKDETKLKETAEIETDKKQIELTQAQIKLALTEPIIEQVEGFSIFPFEDEKKCMELDYPENDVFYYRDNFLHDPKSYSELEKAIKYFSPEHTKNILAITPGHIIPHMNMFITHGNDIILVSVRQVTPILGLIRAKIGDRPFTLDGFLSGSKDAVIQPKDLISAFKKKYPQFATKEHKIYLDQTVGIKQKQLAKDKTPNSKIKFLPQDLLELDRKLKSRHCKFGVLYQNDATQTADSLLSNDKPSHQFYEFLDHIADRIKIKGWQGYRGDLDVKTNATCTHAYFTSYSGLDLMFQVAPLLTPECRARLIGNDVMAIVWVEQGAWNPTVLQSQVLHGFLVVRPVPSLDGKSKVRISVVTREGVDKTNPPVPDKVWDLDEKLRDFVLQKLINTERAAWRCDTKVRNQSRSLSEHSENAKEGQLQFLMDKFQDSVKEFT